jgi:hypothetical protein
MRKMPDGRLHIRHEKAFAEYGAAGASTGTLQRRGPPRLARLGARVVQIFDLQQKILFEWEKVKSAGMTRFVSFSTCLHAVPRRSGLDSKLSMFIN